MLDNTDMKYSQQKYKRPQQQNRGWNGRQKRTVSILTLLHWAFQNECAGLRFSDNSEAVRVNVGTEYVMMMRGNLGCSIDGGGHSHPHDDAQVVVDALALLPVGCGGRAMAVTIACLAQSGRSPDWMQGAVTKVEPRRWMRNRHGDYAAKEVIGHCHVLKRGRLVKHPIEMCPITYSPTGQQIAAARRAYLGWWGALLELRTSLRGCGGLSCHVLTDAMPPQAPWKN